MVSNFHEWKVPSVSQRWADPNIYTVHQPIFKPDNGWAVIYILSCISSNAHVLHIQAAGPSGRSAILEPVWKLRYKAGLLTYFYTNVQSKFSEMFYIFHLIFQNTAESISKYPNFFISFANEVTCFHKTNSKFCFLRWKLFVPKNG